jgi:hypothetical protein
LEFQKSREIKGNQAPAREIFSAIIERTTDPSTLRFDATSRMYENCDSSWSSEKWGGAATPPYLEGCADYVEAGHAFSDTARESPLI